MTLNIGTIDRILRVLLGSLLIIWVIMGGPLWAWLGAVLVATGLVKFCPAYAIFGIKTSKTKG
ncbi:YgaP family membrane protein [Thalassotalea montiporae]